MANYQNNILIEVEQFIGEQLQDYTNDQVIKKVVDKFGISFKEYAEELLAEFQNEISLHRSQDYQEVS
jgi:hypothetical protein|tara:strand:+ start:82 stop:285 length:204 start_codon:yes stop_codon:yes gene_type:complete